MIKLNKINGNWDLFENKNNIRTYLKKPNKNWDQNDILTFFYRMLKARGGHGLDF